MPSELAQRFIEDYIESSGSDRAIFGYIAGLETALRGCMEWMGRDSLGDWDAHEAYGAAEYALAGTEQCANQTQGGDRCVLVTGHEGGCES